MPLQEFSCLPMTAEDAHTIAAWHYQDSYAFYNFDQDPEDLAELLDPLGWKDRYYAVRYETDDRVGFFCFAARRDGVELGLGLRPDLTGKGWGEAFITAGMEFAGNLYTPRRFLVQVAQFNRRAIRVYEKLGFNSEKTLLHRTNSGEFEFVFMARDAEIVK